MKLFKFPQQLVQRFRIRALSSFVVKLFAQVSPFPHFLFRAHPIGRQVGRIPLSSTPWDAFPVPTHRQRRLGGIPEGCPRGGWGGVAPSLALLSYCARRLPMKVHAPPPTPHPSPSATLVPRHRPSQPPVTTPTSRSCVLCSTVTDSSRTVFPFMVTTVFIFRGFFKEMYEFFPYVVLFPPQFFCLPTGLLT